MVPLGFAFINSMPPLLNKRLAEKDITALQMHVSWIMEHPGDYECTNPIMDNFCHRTEIDIHDLVRIVKKGYWLDVQRELQRQHLI